MSAPNASIVMGSTVSTSIGQGSITSASIITTVSAPAITRSLALDFDVELPPGYERGRAGIASPGTGPSFPSTGTTQPPVVSATITTTLIASTQATSLSTSSLVFTPTSGSRSYYNQPAQPVYTTAMGTTT
ncbi:hypothetical protein Hanom_Chr12g01113541 [Helianthus anomalus]